MDPFKSHQQLEAADTEDVFHTWQLSPWGLAQCLGNKQENGVGPLLPTPSPSTAGSQEKRPGIRRRLSGLMFGSC